MHVENPDCFGPCQIILDHFYTLGFFGPFGPFWTIWTILDCLDHFGLEEKKFKVPHGVKNEVFPTVA